MARNTNNRIVKPNIILCEGRDAEEFLINYLNNPAFSRIPLFSNDIQVMDFGGNENLGRYISMLNKMDGFENVRSILVIRDAENDARKACTEICRAFERAGMKCPPVPGSTVIDEAGYECKVTTGFLLFPTCDANIMNGTLEDLCLKILSDENASDISAHATMFLDRFTKKFNMQYARVFKNKLHTYFSATDKYVGLKIGEAAKAGAFDWDSSCLDGLEDFIRMICS